MLEEEGLFISAKAVIRLIFSVFFYITVHGFLVSLTCYEIVSIFPSIWIVLQS